MLRYLGTGQRNYAQRSIRPDRRAWWEFEAALSGHIYPILDGGVAADTGQGARLWLFPPQIIHGWMGNGQVAEVVVFHFSWVPEGIERGLCSQGPVSMPLTVEQVQSIRASSALAKEHLQRPRASSQSHFMRIAAELCCLLWEHLGDRPLDNPREVDRQRVEDALQWYRQHLYLSPSVDAVAQAAFCSPAHFRRLVHAHRGCSPLQALASIRLRRAEGLIEAGDLPLKAIAQEAGFRSHEVFSRSFAQHYGVSPSRWRDRRRHRG
ncbi:MAG: AraC family transcriptional regulator [Planctomycetota bacterium]|nr:MAG: AraC family transcriptional regulator [Planctomycetota bacterium]